MRDFTIVLTRELDGLVREIEAFPDDAAVWNVLPGVTNSAGNLCWHVAGGLQHFVGAMLGKTGYVRDRDAEFSRRAGTRAEVVEELQRARHAVETVLLALPETALESTLSHPSLPGPVPTQRFLVHLCAHAGFHLGQVGYLRRMLTEENQSTGPLPVAPLLY
jgi:uncharacterized damage-inducible protein DinB